MADDGETMRVVIRVRPRLPGEENDGTAGSATAVRISKGANSAVPFSASTAPATSTATSTTAAAAAADAANAAAGIHAGASSGAGTGGSGREDTLNISTAKHNISCRFDDVLGPNAQQDNVYAAVRGCALFVLDGVNATIFAYGPTGTGKTYVEE